MRRGSSLTVPRRPGCGAPRGGRKIPPWKEQARAGPWLHAGPHGLESSPPHCAMCSASAPSCWRTSLPITSGWRSTRACPRHSGFPIRCCCVRCCVRGPRWWWLLLLAVLPIRLLIDVPPDIPGWFLGAVYINDCAKAVLVRAVAQALSVGSDPSDFHARSRLLLPVRWGACAVAQCLRRCGRPQRAWASVLGQRRAMVPRQCHGQPDRHAHPVLLDAAAAESGHVQHGSGHRSGRARASDCSSPCPWRSKEKCGPTSSAKRATTRQCHSWCGRRSVFACTAQPRRLRC